MQDKEVAQRIIEAAKTQLQQQLAKKLENLAQLQEEFDEPESTEINSLLNEIQQIRDDIRLTDQITRGRVILDPIYVKCL